MHCAVRAKSHNGHSPRSTVSHPLQRSLLDEDALSRAFGLCLEHLCFEVFGD